MQLGTTNHADRFTRVATIIFFAWAAVVFTTPVGEGDFFWHVKTGEWIWQHKALPSFDPFSFTVKDTNPFNPESGRIPFLLKQYWLGQLFFYGIWKSFGEAGMVVLRALCYTGILGFLCFWIRNVRQGVLPLLVVIAVGSVLRNYSNERTQLFAFLLMPAFLFVLERIRNSGKASPPVWTMVVLPLIMLLWANCHGSFILGIVIITLYVSSHYVDLVRRRDGLNRVSLLLLAGAILVTLINPNGYGAFREFFSGVQSYAELAAEFTSPIQLAYKFHVIDYCYWLLVAAAAITVIMHMSEMATAHLLVVCALAGLSLTGTRYVPFFVISAPLFCMYIPEWRPRKATTFFNLVPVLIILVLVASTDYRNSLKFRAERAFPVKAVKFLNEIKPQGNMFNYSGWGGYLMCYTGYPVFIDGRILVAELFPVYNSVLAGAGWQSTLDRYGINFLIIPGTDTISLQAYPLLLQLLTANDWVLVYQDDVALIVVRNSPENRDIVMKHGLDKSNITAHIQSRWKWQTTNDF